MASERVGLCKNDGSSLRDSGASVSGERGMQEQVFINTDIWEKVLTVRLFWIGLAGCSAGWIQRTTGQVQVQVHV